LSPHARRLDVLLKVHENLTPHSTHTRIGSTVSKTGIGDTNQFNPHAHRLDGTLKCSAYVRRVIACKRVLRVKAYVGMAWKGKAASFLRLRLFMARGDFGGY
jgi:hypothetical protein